MNGIKGVDLEKIASVLEKAANENSVLQDRITELEEENEALRGGREAISEQVLPKEASISDIEPYDPFGGEMGAVAEYSTPSSGTGKERFADWLKTVSS